MRNSLVLFSARGGPRNLRPPFAGLLYDTSVKYRATHVQEAFKF